MAFKGEFSGTVDPDILVLRSRGPGQLLIAVSVMLAGMLATGIGVRGMIVGHAPDTAPPIVPLGFGILFVVVGGAVTLFRRRTVFDRRKRTVAKWWGFVRLAKREEIPFDAFSGIRTYREACAADESKPLCVALIPTHGEEPYTFYSGADRAAKEVARTIATHLDLEIEEIDR